MSSALGKQTPPDDEWDDLDEFTEDNLTEDDLTEDDLPEDEPGYVLQTRDLVLEHGDVPENITAGEGLTLLNTHRESSSTLLSLALAGRYRPRSGEVEIAGKTKARDRFKVTALAGVTEIDSLERLVPVREVVREQVAWSQPFFSITPRNQEKLKAHKLVEPWLEPLELADLDFDKEVGEIHVLDRFRVRVLLALVARPDAALLIVDDIDQLKQVDLRNMMLANLREVARQVPVLVNTVNDLSDYDENEIPVAVEPGSEEGDE